MIVGILLITLFSFVPYGKTNSLLTFTEPVTVIDSLIIYYLIITTLPVLAVVNVMSTTDVEVVLIVAGQNISSLLS